MCETCDRSDTVAGKHTRAHNEPELNATWNWTAKSAPEDRPEMEIPRGSIDKFVGNGTAVGEASPNAEDETAAKEMQARARPCLPRGTLQKCLRTPGEASRCPGEH